ncbi:Polyketide cyclase / dehydrase and lipid transport [Cohnella sp. OV330]|uniref:SRPBCC family protein n=1 Tax=Cohnella sp. OV330 TaxID=1855288 RepID=UPI0008EFB148|nr:SRPBCC family protein [Cohnella sp. OV330]SFB55792.1 Polyketide cyclase / dehydrase and lipid transport [Cohnella sp. OV330]
MWTFEHSLVTQAKKEAIWALYGDMRTWTAWDAGIEGAELHGPFQAGSTGWLQPEGQERLAFELMEVVPLRTFSDLTRLPEAGIEIRFEHTLETVNEGTRITHRVTIDGPNAGELGPAIGADMAEGIPQTVASLAALALRTERP